jgi:ribosomal protein S18 acetylase RimI-like enzyme
LSDGEITIRRGRRGDVRAVLDLWALARSDHAGTPDRAKDLERLVEDSPAALLVAEAPGQVVGVAIAAWDGWRGNIYRLAVRDSHRRRGIGLQLTRAAEDYLLSQGARRVTALVAFEDDAAGAFWDAAGYPTDPVMGRRVRNLP